MKVRIKCSGLIVELPDGSAIDRSFYSEIKEVQEIEQKKEVAQKQEVAQKRKYKKRKNNDNE